VKLFDLWQKLGKGPFEDVGEIGGGERAALSNRRRYSIHAGTIGEISRMERAIESRGLAVELDRGRSEHDPTAGQRRKGFDSISSTTAKCRAAL
jgi:hypothetical protein